jgi:hypothetical protein
MMTLESVEIANAVADAIAEVERGHVQSTAEARMLSLSLYDIVKRAESLPPGEGRSHCIGLASGAMLVTAALSNSARLPVHEIDGAAYARDAEGSLHLCAVWVAQ